MAVFSPITPPDISRSGNKQLWGGLHGSASALAIAESAKASSGPLLVITADTASAHNLHSALSFFIGDSDVSLRHFTDWETLPYDHFSPHEDIISARLEALYHLTTMKRGIVIVPVTTLMHRLPPVDYLHHHSLVINKNDAFDAHAMRQKLEQAGYRCMDTVYEHGEFAIRGSLMDIYPMGSELPYRIDLFDDTIETLRTFDPETQRTIEQADGIRLLPAKEFPLDGHGIGQFRQQWHQRFDVDHRNCPLYQDVSDGIAPAGIEYYLPLFFEQCASLFDYLPENTSVFTFDGDKVSLDELAEHYWQEIDERYQSRCGDIQRPILKPTELFLDSAALFAQMKAFNRCHILPPSATDGHIAFTTQTPPNFIIDAKAQNPFASLEQFIIETQHRVLFCAESAGRREALLELLQPLGIDPASVDSWNSFVTSDAQIAIVETPIDQGLSLSEPALVIITEAQLFGQQVQQRRRRKATSDNSDQIIKNLTELKVGAPVVHIDHGVGRYRGLETITVDNQDNEFLTLEYSNEAKLYVPVTHLHLISRYTGAEESMAPLHKLGSEQWQKAKNKAAEQVRDVAAELLDIYARRQARGGFAFPRIDTDYQRFVATFPFEETPDQHAAITAVRADMLSPKSMDRLVCGDVGFGKTEVAMRAAFIATQASKQVAILVPTTLLAQQHYENFKDRFADWPVNVEVISRFKQSKDTQAVIDKMASGHVDIIIGTHKLLSSDIKFKALGLLIIDEEHRFGVRQKEAIKSLRSEVDILTMTATPIPRTLNMAMHGIRDLSIIATPPARRLSVKTFVRQRDEHLVKEAVLREILRGGQVYFLHNEVKTIEKAARDIEALIPEARVGIAHGQLRERELEQVMGDYYHLRFNVLVCSTIIETGIDVPNANTIIIERADKFGLAQLHQLRGRVGRSHHQAYAYLLTPPPKTMTKDAVKRLEAIASADDLGAGFTLATHDLEIRGAGELLGEDQSGQIQTIGFTLYMDMLEQTVKAIREGKSVADIGLIKDSVDINLRIPALIPADYLPDVHTRLTLYKRLSAIKEAGALRELQVEMIDRFGLLPEPVKYLVRVTELKLRAEHLGITKVEAGAASGRIEFSASPKVDPLTIVKMVQTQPQNYQLQGANQLTFKHPMASAEERLSQVDTIFNRLSAT